LTCWDVSHDRFSTFFFFFLFLDFQEEAAVEATTEEIQMMASKWVKRSQYSATVVMTGWLAWIIASQVLRHFHLLPAALFMHNADDADLTGW